MGIALIVVSLIVVYTDIRYRLIPNMITFPLLCAGLVYHLFASGLPGFLTALAGMFAGATILFVPFLLGWMGGGDVKFLAAIGAILGPYLLIDAAVISVFTSGIFALGVLAYKGILWDKLKNFFWVMLMYLGSKGKIKMSVVTEVDVAMPYGVFLALGAILTVISKGVIY